jgi:hypothetical protein
MMQSILASFKKQRLVWSWALIVALFLLFFGHAPVLPVVLGGALAILITTLRAASAGQPKPWQGQATTRK